MTDAQELRELAARIHDPGPGHYAPVGDHGTMELLERIAALLDKLETPEPKVADNRAKMWRCRFRIYDAQRADDVVADTDDDLPADAPGTAIIAGLPNVAVEAALIAKTFHDDCGHGTVYKMTESDLARGLRGLRPTLHRNGGKGRWSINYTTGPINRPWLMRIDIVKETD